MHEKMLKTINLYWFHNDAFTCLFTIIMVAVKVIMIIMRIKAEMPEQCH